MDIPGIDRQYVGLRVIVASCRIIENIVQNGFSETRPDLSYVPGIVPFPTLEVQMRSMTAEIVVHSDGRPSIICGMSHEVTRFFCGYAG
jgi:hypothetical protein